MSGVSSAVPLSGDARIDGILSGFKWNLADITYGFPAASSAYAAGYPLNAPNEGFGELSPGQQSLYFDALNTGVQNGGPGGNKWMSVEGFTLQQITATAGGTPTMRAAYSTDPGNGAYSYIPGADSFSGDAWFGSNSTLNYRVPIMGGEVWRSTLHEIGHQLGLKDGHQAQFGNNTVLPANQNSMEYSVMTNSSFVGDPDTASFTNETFGYAQSWMMFDIAALQHMYGADFTHNGGNTSYSWSPATGQMFVGGVGQGTPGANRIFLTIWDGGGIDTFNLSNYTTNLRIDLSPGGHSTFSDAQLANLGGGSSGGFASGNVYNTLLYQGDTRSLIENVEGGSGNDTIRGNEASNAFSGNGGDDILKGAGGADSLSGNENSDTLKGGGGADALNGGSGIDLATYIDSTEGVTVSLDTGTGLHGTAEGDSLTEIENLVGSDYADTLTGSSEANSLDGGGGNDTLNGGLGLDTLIGGAGNDHYMLGADNDTIDDIDGLDTIFSSISRNLTGYAAIENLILQGVGNLNGTGNALVNGIVGTGGNNTLNGGGGLDVLDGRAGNDIYVLGDGNDLVVETTGLDTILTTITRSLTGHAAIENLVLQGTGNINGTGNALLNGILGNSGNNVLAGQDGNDALEGQGGNDFLFGQAGQDSLVGGAGNDTFGYQIAAHSVAGPTCDFIRDFDDADNDRIDLSGVFAGTLTYMGAAAFTGANEVRVQASGANVVVAVNLDADTPPEMQILLLGTTLAQMGIDDFLL